MDGELLVALSLSEEEQDKVKKWSNENCDASSCTFEQRLEKADKLREAGNTFLKEQDFDSALQRYMAAVVQLDFPLAQHGGNAESHGDQINSRKLKVLSNMCVENLKATGLSETKSIADIGLRLASVANLDGETTKNAEARKADVERGLFEDAVEALRKAQALAPNDRQVREVLAQALAEKKKDAATSKKVWCPPLLTEMEVLAEGPWWHMSTILARCHELWCRAQQRFCGRRQLQQGDPYVNEAADAPPPPPSIPSAWGHRASKHSTYSDVWNAGLKRRMMPAENCECCKVPARSAISVHQRQYDRWQS